MGGSPSKYTFGAATTAEEVAAAFPGAVRDKTVLITGEAGRARRRRGAGGG